jgi:ribosomal protein S18 acetylase RimI-like enzyme
MYAKDGLTHWKNSFFKTLLIVGYRALTHSVYAVFDDSKNMIATFQTALKNDALHFSKLAVSPRTAGKGIGSFCLNEMNRMAANCGKSFLRCEVYDKSRHAYDFYVKRGFTVTGEEKTKKYTELTLEKRVEK